MSDLRIERVKIASRILEQVQNTARQYAVAIAGMNSHTEGTVEGTGTLIELGDQVLLVTAEHVISQIEAKNYQGIAFSNGDGKLFSRILERFVKNTEIDIAYVRISRPKQPDSDRQVCSERLMAISAKEGEKDLFFIYGFPGDDSKFWTLLNGIRSKTFTFAANSGVSKDPAFDPTIHLAIRYDPKHCIGISGKEANLPLPHGLSGTAVWKIPWAQREGTWLPDNARIVGIVQKWDQDGQYLIATRIENIFPFLRTGQGVQGCAETPSA